MITPIPEFTYQRGKRRIFYVAKKNKTGKEITAILIDPEDIELPILILKEIGYGVYVTVLDLRKLGPHLVIFFENGTLAGHAIYWAAL